jgi:hypothetical protein
MHRSTDAEKVAFRVKRASYSSIGGESSESSSSSDGEDGPAMSRFHKRIFKDSTSNLQSLSVGADTTGSQMSYFELDPEEMDITNPGKMLYQM